MEHQPNMIKMITSSDKIKNDLDLKFISDAECFLTTYHDECFPINFDVVCYNLIAGDYDIDIYKIYSNSEFDFSEENLIKYSSLKKVNGITYDISIDNDRYFNCTNYALMTKYRNCLANIYTYLTKRGHTGLVLERNRIKKVVSNGALPFKI